MIIDLFEIEQGRDPPVQTSSLEAERFSDKLHAVGSRPKDSFATYVLYGRILLECLHAVRLLYCRWQQTGGPLVMEYTVQYSVLTVP